MWDVLALGEGFCEGKRFLVRLVAYEWALWTRLKSLLYPGDKHYAVANILVVATLFRVGGLFYHQTKHSVDRLIARLKPVPRSHNTSCHRRV